MRKDWQYEKLGDISSSLLIEKAKKRFNPNDVIRYIDISSIDNINQRLIGTTSFKMLDAPSRAQQKVEYGDILISTVRPNLRNIAIVNDDASNLVASSGFCVLRINDAALRRYIFYYVVSNKFTAYLGKLTNGANYPAVKETDVRKAFIPIPPKSTQLSIVSELDKLNELIQIKKEQLKDYDTLAQSIFYEMFGDPVVNEKGWEVKKFGDLFKLKSGDGLSSKDFNTGIYPVYGGNGISGYHNSFNMKGCYIIIGRVGVYCGNVRKVDGEFWLTDNAFRLIYKENEQNSFFILYLLNILDLHQYANAAAQPVISNLTLKSINVPLPPLSLQQSFAHKIEQIDRQKAEVQKTITDLETLLAARMQHWFD